MGAIVLNHLLHTVPSDVDEMPKNFASDFFALQSKKVCKDIWEGTKGPGKSFLVSFFLGFPHLIFPPLSRPPSSTDYGRSTTIPTKGESLSDG